MFESKPQVTKRKRFFLVCGLLFILIILMIVRSYFVGPYSETYTGLTPDTQIPFATVSNEIKTIDQYKNDSYKMIFFYTVSCPICVSMEEFLPEFEQKCVSDSFEFIRVDLGNQKNNMIGNEYGVQGVPTISLLNPHGEEILYTAGFQTRSRLESYLKDLFDYECPSS